MTDWRSDRKSEMHHRTTFYRKDALSDYLTSRLFCPEGTNEAGCFGPLLPSLRRCTEKALDRSFISGSRVPLYASHEAGAYPSRLGWWDEQTLQQTYSPEGSASCVQNFDDSLNSAIRMTYRISLRSSSLWEPRHPLLKVMITLSYCRAPRRP